MIWQLALWMWQLMFVVLWLWNAPDFETTNLRWAAWLTALICLSMVIWYLPKAYRSWLWRRRKSVRPPLEVKVERSRIATALHDSIGSQLVFALSLSRSKNDPELQQTIEQCLLGMRLIVDSMDGQDDELPLCLARFRHRLQPVLDRRGIKLNWQIVESEYNNPPRGPKAQNIIAVLHEAISNILQHAQANEIWVTLNQTPTKSILRQNEQSFLCVEDNGCGIPNKQTNATIDDCTSAGMGLASMYQRARDIGGDLRISHREGGGTCVYLSW